MYYIYIHEISIQWRIFIFVCFRFLPKNGFQEKVVFSPCRSGLGKSSMFSYYFPVTQLLVVWVGGGTLVSPQDSPTHGSVDPNSWKRHNQKLRSEDVIVFLKGTKTRDPPVWNPPPPIDANEFVLVRSYESLLFCFIVRVWPLSHDIMYLHHWLCILESTIHNLRSFPQGLFRSCGWAALMWTRDWEMLKKKSPWTSEAPPCDGCGKSSTKCASNFRNSNASKGV